MSSNVRLVARGQTVTDTNPLPTSPGTPTSTTVKSVVSISTAFARPADTTPYTAGDVVANATAAAIIQVLASAALAAGRGGTLQGLVLTKNSTGVTNARFRVHLFTTNAAGGATMPGQDNAGFAVLAANAAFYLGSIDLPTMSVGTGTNTGALARYDGAAKLFACVGTDLGFVLEALDAYTPVSGETFTLTAQIARD